MPQPLTLLLPRKLLSSNMTCVHAYATGLTEPGGGLRFCADKLTLSQPWGADYAHHITTCPTSGFSDLPTVLRKKGVAISCAV